MPSVSSALFHLFLPSFYPLFHTVPSRTVNNNIIFLSQLVFFLSRKSSIFFYSNQNILIVHSLSTYFILLISVHIDISNSPNSTHVYKFISLMGSPRFTPHTHITKNMNYVINICVCVCVCLCVLVSFRTYFIHTVVPYGLRLRLLY